jgi:hypothetical protein
MVRLVLAAIIACALAGPALAQEDRASRLGALRPDDPMAYFLLGESIAYERADRESHALARRLFVLALHLDEQRDTPLGLASSVCFALADLAEDEADRRWLLSLGESRVRDAERVVWNPSVSLESTEDERRRYELVEAISDLGNGSPREAMEMSRDDEIREFLGGLEVELPTGSVEGLIEWMGQNTTCQECRNRRVSRESTGLMRICRTCGGDPGTHSMRRGEILDLMRFEARMLGAHAGTWGGDLVLQGSLPMRTLRIDEIAPRYGIDTDLVIFMDGRWVAIQVEGATLDPIGSGE